ncbi:F0F1 ATP synthase subunit B [Streptomyces rimosus subsp. rimosus]|uniref:F0F1 ATP synthase subunit B n=1 Tax=Streptomyces rimosus subsp. rimosus TaxID=132474 RepID=A0ABY3YXP9_STRRM|nr:F0F1 ATP synthase subunit B [Streptomyces rimosus subsp. rimosus]UTH94281.1 F0F1 ATP synthase subunit B [Streptomyces rimosus subsp. rimosus]UTJ12377.1 F0F1 ATP synthase subunit B [Streptomyces rimosus subsp. rimosus]
MRGSVDVQSSPFRRTDPESGESKVDVQKKLDEIVRTVGSARSVPMSASCVVNRAELLAMLEEVRSALPGSLAEAQELLGGREQMVEEARAEAERIIESANAHRGSLISDTEVARQSQAEADRILAEARREAEEIRAEADDYVDSKLANFEVVLTKTIGSVDRGREKLLGRAPGEGGHADEDGIQVPEPTADPQTLRERADRYVDAKFGAFEAVLTKTLEAVGRGRLKLQGARPADELGGLAAQPDGRHPGHTGDAEYLAGLAELADPVPPQPQAPPQPTVPPQAQPDPQQGYYTDPAYQQQDAYGYPQAPYAQQDPYGYGWTDPQAQQQHQQPYDPNTGYLQPQEQAQVPGQAPGGRAPQPAALDETSLFDTSMIDLDRLRQYEEGRQ